MGGAETRRGAKSDTLCAVPVGFAIPEAEMSSAAHGHLGRAFFVSPELGNAMDRKIFHKRDIPFMLCL